MKPLTAADVMQTEVLTVKADDSLIDAAMIMLRHRISGLPVIDWSHTLVGMVTEGDLLRRSEIGTGRHRAHWLELLTGPGRAAADYTAEHARKVGEVMSDQLITAAADAPLADVVALMERHHIKRVPILENGKMVGIVSRADLLRAFVDAAPREGAAVVDDDQIRDGICKALDRERWSPRATISAAVKDGVVELTGCVTDYRERAALTVLAENVPGVKKVIDQLFYVEPLSGTVIEPRGPNTAAETEKAFR